MIRLPQRSVTRFFIPLIDVLTLLFCIFLLLPLVESSEGTTENQTDQERLRKLEDELKQHKATVQQLQQEVERLRQEKNKPLEKRLAVRVLEIDPETGKLFYRDPERVDINSEADARSLINRDLREKAVGQRELFYLILYPRNPKSSYPTRGQREQYDGWFRGVALGYDVPGKGPEEK
jgi:cell division protein FtsB